MKLVKAHEFTYKYSLFICRLLVDSVIQLHNILICKQAEVRNQFGAVEQIPINKMFKGSILEGLCNDYINEYNTLRANNSVTFNNTSEQNDQNIQNIKDGDYQLAVKYSKLMFEKLQQV